MTEGNLYSFMSVLPFGCFFPSLSPSVARSGLTPPVCRPRLYAEMKLFLRIPDVFPRVPRCHCLPYKRVCRVIFSLPSAVSVFGCLAFLPARFEALLPDIRTPRLRSLSERSELRRFRFALFILSPCETDKTGIMAGQPFFAYFLSPEGKKV